MTPWAVVLSSTAAHELKRLDPPVAARIIAGLTRFAETGYGDVRKLEGPGDEYRQRVGEWRVRFVYNVDEHAIIVLHVLPRGRAYRD